MKRLQQVHSCQLNSQLPFFSENEKDVSQFQQLIEILQNKKIQEYFRINQSALQQLLNQKTDSEKLDSNNIIEINEQQQLSKKKIKAEENDNDSFEISQNNNNNQLNLLDYSSSSSEFIQTKIKQENIKNYNIPQASSYKQNEKQQIYQSQMNSFNRKSFKESNQNIFSKQKAYLGNKYQPGEEAMGQILECLYRLLTQNSPQPEILKYLHLRKTEDTYLVFLVEDKKLLEYVLEKTKDFQKTKYIPADKLYNTSILCQMIKLIVVKKYDTFQQIQDIFKNNEKLQQIIYELRKIKTNKCLKEKFQIEDNQKSITKNLLKLADMCSNFDTVNFNRDLRQELLTQTCLYLLNITNKKQIVISETIANLSFKGFQKLRLTLTPTLSMLQAITDTIGMQEFKQYFDFEKLHKKDLSTLTIFNQSAELKEYKNITVNNSLKIILKSLELILKNQDSIPLSIISNILQARQFLSLKNRLQVGNNDLVFDDELQCKVISVVKNLINILQQKYIALQISNNQIPQQPKGCLMVADLINYRSYIKHKGQKLNKDQIEHCINVFKLFVSDITDKGIGFPELLLFYKIKNSTLAIDLKVNKIIQIMLVTEETRSYLRDVMGMPSYDEYTIEQQKLLFVDYIPILDIKIETSLVPTPSCLFFKVVQFIHANKDSFSQEICTVFKKKSVNELVYQFEDYKNNFGAIGDEILFKLKDLQVLSNSLEVKKTKQE